jgi:predicted MFS family arabinose efflux permease
VVLITSLGGNLLAWGSLDILCLSLFALIGLVGFIHEQRRAAEPIMPLHLFRHRTFALAGLIGFIVGMSLFGSVTFLPLYLQVVKNATPTSAGLQMLPLMGGLLVVSAITGRLISRWGATGCSRSSAPCCRRLPWPCSAGSTSTRRWR